MSAYNLRQLSSKEGLSNSAILTICQDHDRFMWFGSCDGLNMYDGYDIRVYKPTMNNQNSLSGNLIEDIFEAEDGILWVNTNHGLNRLDKQKRTIEYHTEFQGKYFCAKMDNNEVFAIHTDNFIDYYDKKTKSFNQIRFPGIKNSEIRHFFIDSNNIMWICFTNGEILNLRIVFGPSLPNLEKTDELEHRSKIYYAFKEKNRIYFVDNDYSLFEFDVFTRKKNFVMNLKKEIVENGIVSDIIRDNDDYLVAFQTNGLFRLKNTPENQTKYKIERVGIYCGVFSLYKDEIQDIIWIATDGQGVYMYSRNSFSMKSTTFEDLPYQIQKPVRALLLDSLDNLWVGTKDDGILLMKNYQIDGSMNAKEIQHLTTSNSALANNSVYAFSASRRNLLWIGGDGPGLNYYSYKEQKIKKVPNKSKDEVYYIHSICEVSDSVLWVASVGSGIMKITLSGSSDSPEIKAIKRTMFTKDELSYNYFFSLCRENDSILWFGNRGYGMQRLNLQTEIFESISFEGNDIKTINDILSIQKDKSGTIWAGTSFGIVKLSGYKNGLTGYESFNEIEGLPNNTIHGILEDERGYLWLSTNNGIVQFDGNSKDFKVYNYNNGLNVIEYSDGAYYRDPKTGTLFFGGTNGFVTISPDIFMEKKFNPRIFFTGLKIYENEYNLNDFIKQKNKKEYLQLGYDQNFFSISFIALDYINGFNCKYLYNLENFNNKWIEKRQSNVVSFTDISPGDYILHVKCINGSDGQLSETYSLHIRILPPWYMSHWAYLLYILLLLLAVFVLVYWIRKRYRMKRENIIEKMNQQQKEEIYESKLRFFTNITHELCTPLTLIYGPCDRIVAYPGSDTLVKKYANLILKNAERLNALIQELIEFRRIETGNKTCEIRRVPLSEHAKNLAESFLELAESKTIWYEIDIEENLIWNTDINCFSKILINLLSNAFKYTEENGRVELKISLEGYLLKMSVFNTGKGIKEKDIPYIFDRYRVLENFEKQTQKGISSRNGLGLAICHSMVNLLNGKIKVKSNPDKFTEFVVCLPPLEATASDEHQRSEFQDEVLKPYFNTLIDKPVFEVEKNKFIKSRPTILLVDDDPEMLWFISGIFSANYNIIPVEDSTTVTEILDQLLPDLIISDIMMPKLDGITLMKQVKSNKRTSHIPFILLSAKNTNEEQVEGISAGAEIYVTKPFNVDYIQSVVDRLIQRQDDLKDYYNSGFSAFEFMNGKFIHKEDRTFFEKLLKIIDCNLTNPNFSTEQLASIIGLSTRHLYRRLKTVSDQTPSDLIKEYRLAIVEKMLITTQISIDEIMYKAGFLNRGSFFRIFAQKYGMTPKQYREGKRVEVEV